MATTSFSHRVRPILIVDDDPISLRLTHTVLRRMGFDNTLTCQDSRQVVGLLTEQPISIVLLDLMMPHIGGEELLDFLTGEYPEILVIMNTATEDIDTAVRCIKKGAFDYMTKPIDFSRLSVVIKNALAFQELQQENLALKNHILAPGLKRRDVFDGIVTRNSQMLALFQYAEAIAQTSEPVLITGETGVGKDLIARAIHTLSNCRGSLVPVNVAGLDDNVFSDTLFGHAKGAFTGAEKPRSGLIEQATGGTLFLDEIGDLTSASQAKLLRLLQEGDYFPLGQDVPRRNTARIISATNRNLWQWVEQGAFRKDLNYRLRTHHIHLLPLRERLDDVPLLVDHFLRAAAAQLNQPKPQIPDRLLTLLSGYSFPGNVRELRMMVFDAASQNTQRVLSLEPFKRYIAQRESDQLGLNRLSLSAMPLPDDRSAPVNFAATLPTLKQATELLILEAMQRSKGNQSAAAKLLGVSQQAVSKRLKKNNKTHDYYVGQ